MYHTGPHHATLGHLQTTFELCFLMWPYTFMRKLTPVHNELPKKHATLILIAQGVVTNLYSVSQTHAAQQDTVIQQTLMYCCHTSFTVPSTGPGMASSVCENERPLADLSSAFSATG